MKRSPQVTEDGSHTLFSGQFGENYHSRHGALAESNHVFIQAGLLHIARQHRKIGVLEAGFGTGLNAFLTWLAAENEALEVSYTGIEAYPVSTEEAGLLNYAGVSGVPERQEAFLQLHRAPWGESVALSTRFQFEKIRMLIQEFRAEAAFDVVYFDAFSPQTQPELWTAAIMARFFSALRPGGVLVTYCAQGAFRRNLKAAGFVVESLPGPPFKREITRALRPF